MTTMPVAWDCTAFIGQRQQLQARALAKHHAFRLFSWFSFFLPSYLQKFGVFLHKMPAFQGIYQTGKLIFHERPEIFRNRNEARINVHFEQMHWTAKKKKNEEMTITYALWDLTGKTERKSLELSAKKPGTGGGVQNAWLPHGNAADTSRVAYIFWRFLILVVSNPGKETWNNVTEGKKRPNCQSSGYQQKTVAIHIRRVAVSAAV